MVPLGDVAGDHGDLPYDPVSALLLRVDRGLRVLGAAPAVRRNTCLRRVLHAGEHEKEGGKRRRRGPNREKKEGLRTGMLTLGRGSPRNGTAVNALTRRLVTKYVDCPPIPVP